MLIDKIKNFINIFKYYGVFMKKLLTLLSLFFICIILWNCTPKAEPEEITGMTTYEDPVVKFSLKHPQNWIIIPTVGSRITIFSSKGAKDRFLQYDAEGKAGAKIDLYAKKLDSGKTFEEFMAKAKNFQPQVYSKPVKVILDGMDAYKQTYSFELSDGMMEGEVYYATKDGKYATAIFFEAFGGTLHGYHKYIEEMLASVKLAYEPAAKKPDTILVEAEPPSQNLTTRGGDGYTISIPENFTSTTGSARDALSSRNYIGDRRADCNIQVDVIDATKQQNLKKIVEDDKNKAKYGNSTPSATSIGGQSAYVFSYSPGRNVQSRVFFVIKGNKLFRITMNWFKGEESSYLPIFEKCIKSLKFQ
ncbi:MAG: hypothetical protein A2X63_00225 [Ignavibacteria bacterium GWA2_35_8]|nr:MAG: hypothetical protein A2X63_00225 [Ignavibacteria bacterium GWA2_35_8]